MNRKILLKTGFFLSNVYLVSSYKKYSKYFENFSPLNTFNTSHRLICKDLTDYSHLPTYSRKDIQQHYNKETRIWVAFEDGVYDITEFVGSHPGGEQKILMAAGGYVEPFWAMYSFHHEHKVKDILDKYRIGNLKESERFKKADLPDYSKQKKEKIEGRSTELIKHLGFPYCAETLEEKLIEHFYTPSELFFVRNHNAIPDKISLEDYHIELQLPGMEEGEELKLVDLIKEFSLQKKTTIIACAGNRRNQMVIGDQKTKGIQWRSCAIGNGIWEGIALKDLLGKYGYNLNNCEGLHLICEGNDADFQREHYSISIPLKAALEQGMFAIKYNGENIPFDHGYPVRLVIPGFVGVRNVKWVKKIEISNHESQGHYQQRDYKIIKGDSVDNIDMSTLKPVYTWEVNSSILQPLNNQNISKNQDFIELKGWAFGTNGTELHRVEFSLDDGKNWTEVENTRFDQNDDGKVFGWTQWKHKLQLTEELKSKDQLTIVVRAIDLLGNEQVPEVKDAWNFRGIMNNSYHRISLNLI